MAYLDENVDKEYFVGKVSNIERVVVILLMGERGPQPVVVISTSKAFNKDRLKDVVKERKLKETKIKDHTFYGREGPGEENSDGYCAIDERTIAFGPGGALKGYVEKLDPKKSNDTFCDSFRFKDVDAKTNVVAVFAPRRLGIPEEALNDKYGKPYKPLLQTDWIAAECRVDDAINLSVKVKCGKADPKEVQHSADTGLKVVNDFVAMGLQDKQFHDDPDQANLVKIVEQFAADMKKVKVEVDGDIVKTSFQTKPDGDIIGSAFVEAVQKIRTAANMAMARSNLRQIGIAMNNWEAQTLNLPQPAIYDKNGKPLLSWRVAILPYIEENNLYQQFKLDEPWDSDNNKKLLEKMPKLYATPGADLKDKSLTYYKVFVGKDAIFDHTRKVSLAQIPAGTSNTIMCIEAFDPVPWTKPEDIPFNPKKPLPKLTGPFKNAINVLMADCHVLSVPKDIDEKRLRAAADWNVGDGELSGAPKQPRKEPKQDDKKP